MKSFCFTVRKRSALVGPNTTGIPDTQEAEPGLQNAQMRPGLQSGLKTSLGNLLNVSIRKREGRRIMKLGGKYMKDHMEWGNLVPERQIVQVLFHLRLLSPNLQM